MKTDNNKGMDIADRRLAFFTFLALVSLALLFVLGMYTSLYVPFPEGSNGWKVISGSVVATLHMTIGSIFGVAALGLLVGAIVARKGTWIVLTALGLASSLVAITGGTSFGTTEDDTWSFIMAMGFVGAFLSYAAALYAGRRAR